jgi:signal transduction histidine kinase
MRDIQQIAEGLLNEKGFSDLGLPAGDKSETLRNAISLLNSRVDRIALAPDSNSGRRRAIDVVKELKEAEKNIKPLLERRRIECLEIHADESFLFRTEMKPENFHRIIHILTENALDWIGDNQRPHIRVAVNRLAEEVELLFADNGSGISPEISERVFDPGFSWKENGRGMGLTIARSLLELHGGTIAVARPQGAQGAELRLLLPLKRSRAT